MNRSTHAQHSIGIESLETRRLASATHHAVQIGSLGDSYTDEYRFYPPDRSHAQNWVEQIVHHNRASFGTFSAHSRGAPRNKGYANNWAENGATSADLPAQTAGLAAQAAAGKIDYATVLIGGNDFLDELQTIATDPSAAATASTTIPAIAQDVVTHIETAVGTILAASPNVKVVVATLPPVSDLPIVAALNVDAQTDALVQATDVAEAQVNAAINAFAAGSTRIAVADFAASTSAAVANPVLKIGHVNIDTVLRGDNPHHLFLADGLHPGTVAQGLLANTFIQSIDSSFGAKIKLLTTRQILNAARLNS